jgi:alpha-beta hydrolase superfamily lysophospholipase
MEHGESTFESEGGLRVFVQWWRPADIAPRACIGFIHGLGGHSGQPTYARLVCELPRNGYAFYGVDLRGHGRSAGLHGHVDAWEEYHADVRGLLNLIAKESPVQPVFLLGQSGGGLVILEYALRHPEGLRGLIASAPYLTEPVLPKFQRAALAVLAHVCPHIALRARIDLAGLSRDPEEVKKLRDDPLTDVKYSPTLHREAMAAMRWTREHAADLRLPLLLLHGAADPLTPPRGSQAFFEKVASQDKTLKLYEGGFHNPFGDTNRQEVLADVVRWLDQHA